MPKLIVTGGAPLQNRLLGAFLESVTGLPCSIIGLSQLKDVTEPGDLVLVDCRDGQHERLLPLLRTQQISPECTVALINAGDEAGLACFIELPQVYGIFHEHTSCELLAEGILRILRGELCMPEGQMAAYLLQARRTAATAARTSSEPLTGREREVLRLLCRGARNAYVASRLCVSPHTVKTHIHNIFRKLGVNSRAAAVSWAHENGVV